MPVQFPFFRPRRPQPAPHAPTGSMAGAGKVPEKAPQLPPLKLDPANPEGLKIAEGGRRNSLAEPNPEMQRFWADVAHPAAFDHNGPVTSGFEHMYWKSQEGQMRQIWGREQKATAEPKPSAMEMHRRMQAGGETRPLLESTVKDLPKDARDFYNGTHKWTADGLREELTPKPIHDDLATFRFGGDAPVRMAVPRPPSSDGGSDFFGPLPARRQEPPAPPSAHGSAGFQTIIIPDLPD